MLKRGNTRWSVESSLHETFFDDSGLRLREWLNSSAARIVKTGPHRTVYRLNLPAGRFYLKHYRIPDFRAQMQNLFRPCKAELEWNTARRLAELKISTFEPVALGKVSALGLVKDSFLISREIENSETVQEFVQEIIPAVPHRQQTTLRQQLAVELGRMTARLHREGLIHRDYHAGNILVRLQPDNSLRLWLIDLHAVSHRRRLTLRSMQSNLSLLNHFFSHYSTKSDRLRFFHAYWEALHNVSDLPGRQPAVSAMSPFEQTARRIESHCERAGMRAFRKGDRKWLRGNRRLIVADADSSQCRGIAAVGLASLEKIRDNPELLFSPECTLQLQQFHQVRTAEIQIELNQRTFRATAMAKEVPVRFPRFFHRRRWSDVRWAWEMGHALRRRGIETPLPILFVEKQSDGITRQYILYEPAPGFLPLSQWLRESGVEYENNGDSKSPSAQQCLIESLAEQIRKLHFHGFDHRDLSAANILVARIPQDSDSSSGLSPVWETQLAAPACIHLRNRLTAKQIISNLARLSASLTQSQITRRTNRVRFLKRYLGSNLNTDWKQIWRSVADASRQIS